MLKKLLLLVIGIALGSAGYWAVERYVLPEWFVQSAEGEDAPAEGVDTAETESVAAVPDLPALARLPWGMRLGVTRWQQRPLFCIETGDSKALNGSPGKHSSPPQSAGRGDETKGKHVASSKGRDKVVASTAGSTLAKPLPAPISQSCRVSPGFTADFTKGVLSKLAWDTRKGSRLHKEWRAVGLDSNQTGAEFLQVLEKQGASNFRYEKDSNTEKILTWDIGSRSYRLWLVKRNQPKAKKRKKKGEKSPLYFERLETILSF